MAYTTFEPGDEVGPYKIEKLLGAGNFGRTFKAVGPQGYVALKQVAQTAKGDISSKKIAKAMKAEAAIVKHVQGENIVKFIELLEVRSVPLLVTEYIEGESLFDVIRKSRLEKKEWLDIAQQLFHGLKSIHDAGIVHRDFHLGNILITRKGKAKITDFGIAQGGSKISEYSSLAPDPRIGAQIILAPELLDGKTKPTPSTDLYSLGIVLHMMATGTQRGGDELSQIAKSSVTLHSIRPDIPHEWSDAVEWLCSDAEVRPHSLQQLTDALKKRNVPRVKWKGVGIDQYLEPLARLFQEGTKLGFQLLKDYKEEWLTNSQTTTSHIRSDLPLSRGFERTITQHFGDPDPLLLNGKMIISFMEARKNRSPEALTLGIASLVLNSNSYWNGLLNDPKVNLECKKSPTTYFQILNNLSSYMWQPSAMMDQSSSAIWLPCNLLSSIIADQTGDKRTSMEEVSSKENGKAIKKWKPSDSFTQFIWRRWQSRWIGESYMVVKSLAEASVSSSASKHKRKG